MSAVQARPTMLSGAEDRSDTHLEVRERDPTRQHGSGPHQRAPNARTPAR